MKKKKNKLLDDFKPVVGLAGMSIGSGLVGQAIAPTLPAGVSNPLASVSSISSGLIVPVGSAVAGKIVLRQFDKISKTANNKKLKSLTI